MNGPEIAALSPQELEDDLPGLAEVLHASVMAGASINFIMPYDEADATRFWREKVLPALRGGRLALLVARIDGRIVGTVQLDCDTPPNQPHRAEVRKLMVHPSFRNRGIARALMAAVEDVARTQGRSLITLDTRTGDKAEPLYLSLGYRTVGIVPGYARDVFEDRWDDCTFMYKQLPPNAAVTA